MNTRVTVIIAFIIIITNINDFILFFTTDLQAGVGLLSVSNLHQVSISGQRHKRRKVFAGINQSAVNIQLHVGMLPLQTAQPQDDGVGSSIGHVGVLQVDGVELSVSFDITNQD